MSGCLFGWILLRLVILRQTIKFKFINILVVFFYFHGVFINVYMFFTDHKMAEKGVSEWYSGRSVFITGGTGYMGKVLVEKLLRDCDNIKSIYILCRPKRGFSPAARIEQIRKLAVEYLNVIFDGT